MKRGFTLMEVMLAASIGSVIVIATASVFAALDRYESRTRVRYESTLELARTRNTVQDALRTLIMSDDALPPNRNNADEEDEEPRPIAPGEARLMLTFDQTQMPEMRIDEESFDTTYPQRLEVVMLKSPLWYAEPREGEADPSQLYDNSLRAAIADGLDIQPLLDAQRAYQEQLDREIEADRGPAPDSDTLSDFAAQLGTPDLEDDPFGEFVAQQEPFPAIRGAFEITRDAAGWSLWFQQYGGEPRRELLASGLRKVGWTAFRESERVTEIGSVWAEDLPGYMELEIITARDVRHKWMFELQWTSGAGPTASSTRDPNSIDPNADPNDPAFSPEDFNEDLGVGGRVTKPQRSRLKPRRE